MEKEVLNNNENNNNHEKRSKKSLSELETVRTIIIANFSTTNLCYATAGTAAFTNLIVHVLPNAHKADGKRAGGDEVNKSFWS